MIEEGHSCLLSRIRQSMHDAAVKVPERCKTISWHQELATVEATVEQYRMVGLTLK